MKSKTVVIGMSGGVDSSIAALLLKQQGYNVIGAFMKNFSDTKNKISGECTWRQDYRDAQKIAAILNIPLHLFDFEKEYKLQVISPMFKDYKKGSTPNPDILCNKIIKFPLFWKHAKKLGADYIAMGHYAQIKKAHNGFQLLQGKDKTKDQSYFLAGLTQEDLKHTLFPIGKYTKTEIRRIAKKNKFPNHDKHGTVGICFVGKVDMQSFLKKKIKEKPGEIIAPSGDVIGTHPGIMFYTIGQKIGPHIGLHMEKPKELSQERWYIAEKLQETNTLVAAPDGHSLLKKDKASLSSLHLINPKDKIPKFNLKARIRHLGKLHPGVLKEKTFFFKNPVDGLAEGQTIAIYHKSRLIASGEIRIK